jgi:hypothetical protein
MYLLRGADYDHVLIVVAPGEASINGVGASAGAIDRIVQSFRVEPGQGA